MLKDVGMKRSNCLKLSRFSRHSFILILLILTGTATKSHATQNWPTFETNHAQLNLFEPKETVRLNFNIGNIGQIANTTISGFEYEIRDFDKTVVKIGTINLNTGQTRYTATYLPKQSGYYEVRAYFKDKSGKRIGISSVIKSTGSMPTGMGTFAVMPSSIADNKNRIRRVGSRNFFGMSPLKVVESIEYMGFAWYSPVAQWNWIWAENGGRPDRSGGMAPWAQTHVNDGPLADHLFLMPFLAAPSDQNNLPSWAIDEATTTPPPILNMDDYWNYVRDFIAAYQAKAPQVQSRVYDFFDEIDVNTEAINLDANGNLRVASHSPFWTAEDVVDWARQGKEFITQYDPGAIVIGPQNTSPITLPNLDFLQTMLEGGLLNYIDGYSFHGYHQPESGDGRLLDRIREVKTLLRQYNNGQDFPMYQTEAGYRSAYPQTNNGLREHANWHVRYAVILKGEGVSRHNVFYEIDFANPSSAGEVDTWGINFNLDPELRFGDVPRAPKPALPALATAAKMLEGFFPVEDLIDRKKNRWGYRFSDGKTSVVVVWDPHGQQIIDVPVAQASSASEVDIMGRVTTLGVNGGNVKVKIGASPKYIVYKHAPELEQRKIKFENSGLPWNSR